MTTEMTRAEAIAYAEDQRQRAMDNCLSIGVWAGDRERYATRMREVLFYDLALADMRAAEERERDMKETPR